MTLYKSLEWLYYKPLDMIYDQAKYVSLCVHDFQKSLTNVVELPCREKPDTIHKITQFGKICNKCTHIIKDSLKYHHRCIVCADQLEDYLKERELCQHDQRDYDDIVVKCLDSKDSTHEVSFSSRICKRCSDKLRAAFLNSKKCKVCDDKADEVLRDMEKTFVSSAFSHFRNVISLLSEAKPADEVYKNQIESACQAEHAIARVPNKFIPDKLIQEFRASDTPENHQSKRYKLYPKCRKHKDVQINVCNMCLVALLNLDACPLGCAQEQKVQKSKADKQVKISQTGFLFLYPQKAGESNHLELFVLKLIEQRGRMDRWQCKIQKVTPKSAFQVKFQQKFPLFYQAVAVSQREFLVCGGLIGPHINKMKVTSQAFVVSLAPDLKEYSIIQIPPMKEARSGHSLAFHQSRKMVFVVGGLGENKSPLKSTQVFLLEQNKWFQLKSLNIERTRTTAFVYKDNVYALGGQSNNPKIYEVLLERLNFQDQSWQQIVYDGYDFPYICETTSSTSLPSLQNKENLFIFGGSNINDTTNQIQSIKIDLKQKMFELNHLKVLNSLRHPRVRPTLGFIKEDTLIVFGGLEEHQNLFANIQGFVLKNTQNDFSIFAPLDDIAVGSYRLILRQDSKNTYKRLQSLLEEQGILNKQKKSKLAQKNMAESHDYHLIERLWYTYGKSMIWVPMSASS